MAVRRVTAIAALVLLTGTGLGMTPQDWTRFRGPDGAGLSDARTIPTSFEFRDVNWRIELPGAGHSSPIIHGDHVYVTWVRGREGHRTLGCLNTADGSIEWQYEHPFEAHEQHRDNSFASSTPTADDERVYCYWSSGDQQMVVAIDHNGHRVWERVLGPFIAEWGTGSSPVLVEGVLIVTSDDEGTGGFLTGLDPATGAELWRRPRGSGPAAYSTPTVMYGAEGEAIVLCASTAHGVTGLKPRDGAVLWEVDCGFQARCVASPVLAGGLIYQVAGTGGGGKEACAIRPPGSDSDGEATIVHRPGRNLPYVPTPIAYGSWIFFFADNGIVSCLHASDGEVLWRERVEGRFYGSPICVNGALYCMSRDGDLFVLDAADEFQLLAQVPLAEGSSATPAVAGGVLYLRTERHLISVGGAAAAAPAPDDRPDR